NLGGLGAGESVWRNEAPRHLTKVGAASASTRAPSPYAHAGLASHAESASRIARALRALQARIIRPNFRQVTAFVRAPNVQPSTMEEQSARTSLPLRRKFAVDFHDRQIQAPRWRNQENPMIPPRVSVDVVRERIGHYADKKATAEERYSIYK